MEMTKKTFKWCPSGCGKSVYFLGRRNSEKERGKR